ncbi:hypothetical protein [Nitratireductor sp. XY-223]|uniref:hypothetical protein n=1 Tax=Nitratireductor sp. XY-223 TaxID=2561926 RepID=UPI0010A9CDA5|nr:hypothetical protein [Nitratireductor sp. XY-223]
MLKLRRSQVAGSYEGTREDSRLILRADVGSDDSMGIISGDLYFADGAGEFEFHHSFQTTGLVLEEPDGGTQLLRGPVKVHRQDTHDIARIDLRIPEDGELVATYTFYRLTNFGRQTVVTLLFPLTKTSSFFRRVELEIDQVKGVPLPGAFDPSQHPDTPPDLPSRPLTLDGAYRQAGIELAVTLGGEDVAVEAAGEDALWTDEELHAAMVDNFAAHADVAQWRLYLLLATKYVEPGVLGIMFDSGDDFPRQGAAVFAEHPSIANAPELEREREYLFTIVHELGHAFNFLHSFQKGIFETHGMMPRPGSLSWMNYPDLFPFGYAYPDNWDGSGPFWTQFRYDFDRHEISHLRHNDALEVIMGGRSFGFAGHLEERAFEREAAAHDISFKLWLPQSVEFMEQVEGDVRVRNDSTAPVEIAPSLRPSGGALEILIRRPGDRFPKVYRHFADSCMPMARRVLAPGEAVYQELNLSFGRRHWYVDEPGTYEVQAIYNSPDGRRLRSEVRKMRVLRPDESSDKLAADFFGVETGTYLGVEGSRAQRLTGAADLLETVRERIPKSALAHQIERVNALRNTRVFKCVSAGKVYEADRKVAADGLIKALSANLAKRSVGVAESQSHLKVSRQLRAAARCYATSGEPKKVRDTLATSKAFLQAVKAPNAALASLAEFSKSLRV